MIRPIAFVLLLPLVVLAPATSHAQQFKASVTGTVVDSQGALIPGATVTVTNTETNVATESVTDSSGAFAVKDVVPGKYKVTASLTGFKTFVREGIILHTAETAAITVKLDRRRTSKKPSPSAPG